MNIETQYETYTDCHLTIRNYSYSGDLAIQIWNEEDGPIAALTVCLPDERRPKENEAYIDTNNCPWALDFIKKYNIGEETGLYGFSGYRMYPLVKFNMEEVRKWS